MCDVANHLKVNFNATADVSEIESGILLKMLEKALEKMSEDEKKEFFKQFGVDYKGVGPAAMAALIAAIRASGFQAYKLALIVANAVAKALVGRGLSLGANVMVTRLIGVAAGPIGLAITALMAIFDLAGPAYRITVPCVVQIAYMRQKSLVKECHNCGAPVASDAAFCSECGHSLT